jgi:hypothetical protein
MTSPAPNPSNSTGYVLDGATLTEGRVRGLDARGPESRASAVGTQRDRARCAIRSRR